MDGARTRAGHAREALARAGRALTAGVALTRRAWREAGAALGLSALGAALAFVADHAALETGAAANLRLAGWGLVALVFPAKLGALYRLASGSDADLEPGGLQWRRLDGRLAVTAISLLSLAAFLAAAGAVATVVLLSVLRPLGVLDLGGGVSLGVGFVVASPLIAAALAAGFAAISRMMLVLPAEAVQAQPRFAEGFLASPGHGLAASAVVAAAFVAPTAVWLGLVEWLDALEGVRAWPLWDALAAGAVVGALASFVAAPLLAGALAGLYAELTGAAPLAPAAAAGEAEGCPAPQEPCAP